MHIMLLVVMELFQETGRASESTVYYNDRQNHAGRVATWCINSDWESIDIPRVALNMPAHLRAGKGEAATSTATKTIAILVEN